MITKFNDYKDSLNEGFNEVDYSDVDSGESDEHIRDSSVSQYHKEIDDALSGEGIKVVKVYGFADETDSDLEFVLSDGNSVEVTYVFHPYSGKMKVTAHEAGHKKLGERGYTDNEDTGGYRLDAGETGVGKMIREIYTEAGLLDPVKFVIRFPKEVWGNGIYYDNNPENGNNVVGFENEEDAKSWIEALAVQSANGTFRED
jgi:hypothetical protein